MLKSNAEVIREYGPIAGAENVHGVTFDGKNVWIAGGDKLVAIDPANGTTTRSLDVACHAGKLSFESKPWKVQTFEVL